MAVQQSTVFQIKILEFGKDSVWAKLNTDTSTGHKGGTMCRLVRVRKCSMSLTSWRMLIRLTVCRAKAIRPRGGCVRAQLTPVGITTTLVAPKATAVEIGVLLATPPSTRKTARRFVHTGTPAGWQH